MPSCRLRGQRRRALTTSRPVRSQSHSTSHGGLPCLGAPESASSCRHVVGWQARQRWRLISIQQRRKLRPRGGRAAERTPDPEAPLAPLPQSGNGATLLSNPTEVLAPGWSQPLTVLPSSGHISGRGAHLSAQGVGAWKPPGEGPASFQFPSPKGSQGPSAPLPTRQKVWCLGRTRPQVTSAARAARCPAQVRTGTQRPRRDPALSTPTPAAGSPGVLPGRGQADMGREGACKGRPEPDAEANSGQVEL